MSGFTDELPYMKNWRDFYKAVDKDDTFKQEYMAEFECDD